MRSRNVAFVSLSALVVLGGACTERTITGEGQFSRPIPLASDPSAPLPRLAWQPGPACPGPEGGCSSFCTLEPDACDADACVPLLIDSGTPISILPDEGPLSFGETCMELRGAGGLLDAPTDPDALAASSASFRLLDAPIVHVPRSGIADWSWQAGADGQDVRVGGVLGGNVLRDFAVELRHRVGESPSVAFFTEYPGSEEVLGDQGRAYIRLQFPGRLLGRLLNDRCDIGDDLGCRLSGIALTQDAQELLFESTRALVDACVAPRPCQVEWRGGNDCVLQSGGTESTSCTEEDDLGATATLVVATGVPDLVLFRDSAIRLLGDLDLLPDCAGEVGTARACNEGSGGFLNLPGWAPLTDLRRVRVRALGLVEGLSQPSGVAPCQRLRERLRGLERQCEAFAETGRPVRPSAEAKRSVASSALVLGEAALAKDRNTPDPTAWLATLIVPETAEPVLSLRREVVPEGAQPDGLVGGALLRDTETVLDFTEPIESPGVRVRCLDPGTSCLAIPACSADVDTVIVDGAELDSGRTSCCFGLPTNLIAEVVLEGEDKEAPRVEDACCAALPRAALDDLQNGLGLCTGVDFP